MSREPSPNLSGLSAAEKRQLLQELLHKKALEERKELSQTQLRMWIRNQLNPLNVSDNLSLILRLPVGAEIDRLLPVLHQLYARHDVLRRVYRAFEGSAVSELHDGLLDVTVAKGDVAAAQASVREPFQLSERPPIRIRIFEENGGRVVLALAMHHICGDRISLARLIDEATSKNVRSEPPTTQFYDYVREQKRFLASPEGALQREFWRKQTGTFAPAPFITKEAASTSGLSESDKVFPMEISGALTSRLRQVARQQQTTFFSLLLTAYQALIFRVSGLQQYWMATPVSGRRGQNFADTVGCLADMLPILASLEDTHGSLQSLNRHVHQRMLLCLENQDYPYGPIRDHYRKLHGWNPGLAEVFFSWLEDPRDVSRMTLGGGSSFVEARNGIRLEILESGTLGANAALGLTLFHSKPGIIGHLSYRSSLFHEEEIRQLAEDYLEILSEIAFDPDAPAVRKERVQISRAATLPVEKSVGTLFAEQASKQPDRPALQHRDRILTYRELDREVERIAAMLTCEKQQVIGVFLERSPFLIASILAIHRRNCAYLPLDVRSPSDRLLFTLEDADASLVLTQRSLASNLPEGPFALLCVEDAVADTAVRVPAELDDLAYVIYTSGSTGRPKGVEISQRALSNVVLSLSQRLGILPDDRWLAVTPISFDIAALELLLPLTLGACVVIADADTPYDGKRLGKQLDNDRCTVMQATPAGWQVLIESGWAGRAGLKMLCGGEALSRQLAEDLLDRGGELFNLYGPTETTIWSTYRKLDKKTEAAPSIGFPIDNTETIILDADGREVPQGAVGELYLGGMGLARGYVNRPELTNEKFIEHARGRLYRTGDRVRLLAGGDIEYLGRADSQIKLRGFRIEPGEIESVLCASSLVSEAAVVLHRNTLAAYVVTQSEPADLAANLRTKLPEYMIPSRWIVLDRMPLTPHGKIDRPALPAPPESSSEEKELAILSPLEESIAQLWRRLLDNDLVGPDDDFFEIGGHSLLAVRMFYELEKILDRPLPISMILGSPTVRKLARAVETPTSSSTCLIELQPHGTGPALYIAHGLFGQALQFADFAAEFGPDQKVIGLQAPRLDASVSELAEIYAREIAQQPGPYMLMGLCAGGIFAYEIAQQLRGMGKAVSLVVILMSSDHLPVRRSEPIFRLSAALGRIRQHFDLLRYLPLGGRFAYLLQKARAAATPWPFFSPPVLAKAIHAYKRLPYPGRIEVFVEELRLGGAADEPWVYWDKLAAEVGRHEIPGPHGGEILFEPVRSLWIDKLKRLISEARLKS